MAPLFAQAACQRFPAARRRNQNALCNRTMLDQLARHTPGTAIPRANCASKKERCCASGNCRRPGASALCMPSCVPCCQSNRGMCCLAGMVSVAQKEQQMPYPLLSAQHTHFSGKQPDVNQFLSPFPLRRHSAAMRRYDHQRVYSRQLAHALRRHLLLSRKS